MKKIRSPICAVLGHVDHGKSSILDFIRHTTVAEREAGKITQAIGASIIPLDTIKRVSGPLLQAAKINYTIPGLLFIDTPGHAAFTTLRKRGGSIADIAILVVDIKEGFKPQTVEALEILKQSKTPFVVAANKLDLIPGWSPNREGFLLQRIQSQQAKVITEVDTKVYELVGKLSEFGFDSERFDRVDDFTKKIGIVPCSAKTGVGIPELLMVMAGLAQKYLEASLKCECEGPAKGTILEIKEEKGIGNAADVIIYEGALNVNDTVVIGSINEPIVSKVKALFEPAPLAEMRDKRSKYKSVKSVSAATGVRISAPDIGNAVAGMPIIAVTDPQNIDKAREEVQSHLKEVLIATDKEGVILKADSLGSLEALTFLMKEHNIAIRKASLGNVSKKDIADAESVYEADPLKAVIIGFNIKCDITDTGNARVFTSDIIYKLIDDYEAWKDEQTKKMEQSSLESIQRPFKISIMHGYVFRQSNPAVVGVEVSAGTLKPNSPIMKNDGVHLAEIKGLQEEQKNVDKAEAGKQVAASIPHVTVGRQIHEGDILYSDIPEEDFRKLKEFRKLLSREEIGVLKEIADIKRKNNPVWGV